MRVAGILEKKGDHSETIGPDAPVVTAIHKLASLRIGALMVTADGETVVGVLSERDVVVGLNRHGTRLLDMSVAEVMSKAFRTCELSDTVTGVMTLMTRTRNRHLPVVEEGRLCGVVSVGDVVKSRLDEMDLESRVLRDAYLTRR